MNPKIFEIIHHCDKNTAHDNDWFIKHFEKMSNDRKRQFDSLMQTKIMDLKPMTDGQELGLVIESEGLKIGNAMHQTAFKNHCTGEHGSDKKFSPRWQWPQEVAQHVIVTGSGTRTIVLDNITQMNYVNAMKGIFDLVPSRFQAPIVIKRGDLQTTVTEQALEQRYKNPKIPVCFIQDKYIHNKNRKRK